jgi:hypothetical protein
MMAKITRLEQFDSIRQPNGQFIRFTFDMDVPNAKYTLSFLVDNILTLDQQNYFIMEMIFSAVGEDFTKDERTLLITECFKALGWWK